MERAQLGRLLGGTPSGAAGGPQVVEESDPERFMGAFARAVSAGGNIFLANPEWRATERAELGRIVGGDACGDWGWLMIPSGGSAGTLRFARHDEATIAAAVGGFCRHFEMERVNSISVLPLHHVGGLMAWMRSALTGGIFAPWPWKEAEAGRFPRDMPHDCTISLVPTQLQRLLSSERAVAWLRTFRIVFVGGGPAWSGLIEEAARLGLPLSPCYGATETAAMVAAVKPAQFLGGMRGCGAPLPHARIDATNSEGLSVSGESVFRGYFPDMRPGGPWITGDAGSFDPDGSLVLLGRTDDLIVTGGKKVAPAEVEAALRASGEFEDVAVIGLQDPEWGQLVVACHPPGLREPAADRVRAALSNLASFKRPRRYVCISPWPRNVLGKINRVELLALASKR
jgi:o-succinylbenzoate---CoA ligase